MSRKPATEAEKAHLNRLHMLGCLACRQRLKVQVFPTQAHHLLSGGRRIGHFSCIPLCNWHHVGERLADRTTMQMTLDYGPSLARGSKAFHIHFGTDDELLEETNRLLENLP